MNKIIMLLLPARFFYGDHLTSSARRLAARLVVALLGLVVACVAIGLLNSGNWSDVLAGALFAWATSVIAWAISSYRSRTEETAHELRHASELDLLHGRLNHLADNFGLPLLNLQEEVESVLRAREERLAHFAGLDEYRETGPQPGAAWWDSIALGFPRQP